MTYSWRGGFGGLEVLATAGCCWCVQFGTHQVACPAPLIANPLSAALSDYAFVHMEKEADAKAAIAQLNGKEVKGKRINVELSTMQNHVFLETLLSNAEGEVSTPGRRTKIPQGARPKQSKTKN